MDHKHHQLHKPKVSLSKFTYRKLLHKRYVIELIRRVEPVFRSESNVVEVEIPKNGAITICGDLHGQYSELLTIFKLNGYPTATSAYFFTGDYVDRGYYSIEVLITLMAWKCLHPNTVHLIRGNHENRQVHKLHG
eukprot:TRINITY_DN14967_c0_g1_i1.p1 TRINITY_DN14967_c0_g1~~TRINITY_DN14967_c0_g1_i1.p1  ORF type:complete len:135 (+),score=16.64 TRINITY_DN14967_c0_g1_i1:304-708(+)